MAETAMSETTPLLHDDDNDGTQVTVQETTPDEADDARLLRRTRRANRVPLASIALGIPTLIIYVVADYILATQWPENLWLPLGPIPVIATYSFWAIVAGIVSSSITWRRRRANEHHFNSNAVFFTIDAIVVGVLWVNLPYLIFFVGDWLLFDQACDGRRDYLDRGRCDRFTQRMFALSVTFIILALLFSIVQATIVVLRGMAAYRFRQNLDADLYRWRFPSFSFGVEVTVKFRRQSDIPTAGRIGAPPAETAASESVE